MVAGPEIYSELRVLVVGDDPLARGGLAGMLLAEPGLVVADQVPAAAESLALARGHDVVAWDLGVDSGYGLDRFRDLALGPAPAVALLGSDPSGTTAAGDVLGAGARGVLYRDVDGARLRAAVRACAAGLVVLDESLAVGLAAPRAQAAAADPLSPREAEVLQLLAEGHPNKIIADRLHISDHTAKFHVNAIFAKLGVQSRTEAVVRAVRMGWLAL